MAGVVMMERTLGATSLPGMMTPTTPAGGALVIPRCTMRIEKCADGCKIHCCCDDDLTCATLQNLCKQLCEGLCSLCCMQNGICICQCNFAMCHCTMECTKDGVCITCCSGDEACCQQVQACCECIAQCLAAGCTCCVCYNGTPVCCGSC